MLRINSIKHQTLVLLVSLTLVLAVVFSSLAVVTAFMVEDAVLSNLLDEQAVLIEQHYARHGQTPVLPSGFMQVFENLENLPEWAKERVFRPQLQGEIFTPDGTHYHYKKLMLSDTPHNTEATGILFAEVSKLLAVTNQPHIFALFLLVFFVAIALAIYLAVKFSQKIVQPVLMLTNAVKLTEADAASTTPLPKLEFELGYLADAMQSSFAKLNLLLEREKAFSTNVSHELRTPLTVLKNSCTLIAQRGFQSSDLTSIKNSCEQMEHIVDVLLELARAESLTLRECNATFALEHAIMRCETLPQSNLQVHVDLPNNLTLFANQRLLELLFFNLLRNAAEHASEPQITISATDNTLVFENSQSDQCLVEPTKAGNKGAESQGVGQGLYLVARIVEQFGWHLALDATDNRFRVTIATTLSSTTTSPVTKPA